MGPKATAAHLAGYFLHHGLKGLITGAVLTALVLLAIRGACRRVAAPVPVAPPSGAGPWALGLIALAAAVIFAMSRSHPAAHAAVKHAARQKVITRTVIQHVVSHPGLNWPEAAAVIVALVLTFVYWLNHR